MSEKELHLKRNGKNGFSLVETLVAIFILAMAITSAMAVAQSSLLASFFARDRVTAYFLAQEAVEVVKNIRDENRLENRDNPNNLISWSSRITDLSCKENDLPCGVDIINNSVIKCADFDDGCRLKREANGIFNHSSSGDDTRFTRTVEIESVGGTDDEIKVTVTVSWPQALNQNKNFVMTEHIFNWLSFGG